MLLGYKFRLKPNLEQQEVLNQWMGTTRFVWNTFLSENLNRISSKEKRLTYNKTSAELTNLKSEPKFNWIKDCESTCLQQKLRDLDRAFKDWGKKSKGKPKFKSKFKPHSIRFMSGVKILPDGSVKLPKIKSAVKCNFTREVKSFSSVTISRNNLNQYYISFCTEQKELSLKPSTPIGIDLGISSYLTTSEGKKVSNGKNTKRGAKNLKTKQKKLSRKQKKSRNRLKAKRLVAKVHKKISNRRLDFLHKLSRKLVDRHSLICVEDLAVSNMIRNKKLSKSIADCAWGTFLTMLEYKSKLYGSQIVFVNRFYPSSKICSNCGWKNKTLGLSDRVWECENCEAVHDRDTNAAVNILLEGLKLWGLITLRSSLSRTTQSLLLWCKTLTQLSLDCATV